MADAKQANLALLLALLFNLATPTASRAQSLTLQRKVTLHKLESFEVIGTERVDSSLLAEELGLVPGMELDDDFVMEARRKLLSLGLFRNVLLYQRKGHKPGYAKLIIEVVDDDRVLTSNALGGSVGVFLSDPTTSTLDADSEKLTYQFSLIQRNLFRTLHRASFSLDLDSSGEIRSGRIAYGLPRFTQEDMQFDVEAAAVDVRARYLDAMAYGGRVQGLWTRSTGEGDVFFGPAMYFNRAPRFGYKENPESSAGPRLGYNKETRLLGFVPSSGYRYGASILYSVARSSESLLELSGAYTFSIYDALLLTLDTKGLAITDQAYALRGESRFDIPLSTISASALQSVNLFVRLRAGKDKTQKRSYSGSSAIIGVQYFSSGFIANFGIEITKSPKQFLEDDVEPIEAGGDEP